MPDGLINGMDEGIFLEAESYRYSVLAFAGEVDSDGADGDRFFWFGQAKLDHKPGGKQWCT